MKDYRKLSDQELSGLLKQSDQDAFTEIYHRYKGILFIHALKLLKDPDEAQDLIHELFLSIWTKAGSLNLSTSLNLYLNRAIRNRIFDHFSKKKVSADYIARLALLQQESRETTDEILMEKELAKTIEEGLSLLPEKMRQIFEMSRFKEMSHKEIASELGISDKTVKVQIQNALKILRLKINSGHALWPFL